MADRAAAGASSSRLREGGKGEAGMESQDHRVRVLMHLVGQTRAYLQQLDGARTELNALHAPDLDHVMKAVEGAKAVVAAVDSIATRKLRDA